MKGARGRGTLEKEKPPIFGMIQRGGEVVLQMLPNVKQKTIKPYIEACIQPGSTVYTDEYAIYSNLTGLGYDHKTVIMVLENTHVMRMEMVSMRCSQHAGGFLVFAKVMDKTTSDKA